MRRFQQISDAFGLLGTVETVQPLGSGHVHTTYLVTCREGRRYVFQKMNTTVFCNPAAVMRNMLLVTDYLRTHFPTEETLRIYVTKTGEPLLVRSDGVWRVMDYIDGTALVSTEDLKQLRSIGTAYGRFQARLTDFDAAQLTETLPDFHNTPKYLASLFSHAGVGMESFLERIAQWQAEASAVCRCYAEEGIPLRVVHYDTKCSNVLLDKNGQPLAVIDLDTVMQGMAAYDFGDAVRSAAVNREGTALDMRKFRAFAEGYLQEVRLCAAERACLVPAVFSVSVELAARYLEDVLTNGKNLGNADPMAKLEKVQALLEFAASVQEQKEAMEAIVQALS